MKGIFKIFIMTSLLLAFHGCVKEIDADIFENEYIAFSARLSDEATKATPTISLDGKIAKVIGYTYLNWPSDEQLSTFTPLKSLDMKTFKFDGDQFVSANEADMVKWSTLPNQETGKLKVYAYSPENLNFTTEIKSDGTTVGRCLPTISYTVPDEVSAQTDIITAVSEVSAKFRKNIPLTFDHTLTAIKFRSGFSEAITVNSIQITNVKNSGTYTIGEGWKALSGSRNYTIQFDGGKSVQPGAMITDNGTGDVLFMIPQTFDENSEAEVILTYDNNQQIRTTLKGAWEMGRMITYTLHKDTQTSSSNMIYFDLAAGDITITGGGDYSGHIYINNGQTVHEVTGKHSETNKYYVYQSTSTNRSTTGWPGAFGNGEVRVPEYSPVRHPNGTLWSDWITNNTDVTDVIESWDNQAGTEGAVITAGRSHTSNKIHVSGTLICNITIDNIYSRYHHANMQNRVDGGITFLPTTNTQSELTINIKGDNRVGCIHYVSGDTNLKNRLILEGTGSLTVADADFRKSGNEYYANHYDSVIGGSDNNSESWGITINSGTIFAGSTKKENCSCIGGGGNGTGHVTINGGRVTAVASTTGTAIGGGIGYSDKGGIGRVYINGGDIYAYNFTNVGNIPSSAIGGAGSSAQQGNTGIVEITGGNIYAYSADGTAIGGGSSVNKEGGNADITIKGNATVIAKTGASNASIGGGKGTKGGSATIKIEGTPIIRTGSIGGGKATAGTIGTADITISGGDIQAQFVMAAGASTTPKFAMTGGLIRNSDTDDQEYIHIQNNGGAVYLEDGEFSMTDGEIRQCRAENGGAIYIKGTASTRFSMSGGRITECVAVKNGGALYLEGGKVSLSGGKGVQ